MTFARRRAVAEIAELASSLEPDRRVVLAWMAEVPIHALGGKTALELAEDGNGASVSELLRRWIRLERRAAWVGSANRRHREGCA